MPEGRDQGNAFFFGAGEQFVCAVIFLSGGILGILPLSVFGIYREGVFFGENAGGKPGVGPEQGNAFQKGSFQQRRASRLCGGDGVERVKGVGFGGGKRGVEIFFGRGDAIVFRVFFAEIEIQRAFRPGMFYGGFAGQMIDIGMKNAVCGIVADVSQRVGSEGGTGGKKEHGTEKSIGTAVMQESSEIEFGSPERAVEKAEIRALSAKKVQAFCAFVPRRVGDTGKDLFGE